MTTSVYLALANLTLIGLAAWSAPRNIKHAPTIVFFAFVLINFGVAVSEISR